MSLQSSINSLYDKNKKISLDQYNDLLKECVLNKEFAATVFVYEHLIKNYKPVKTTFEIIEKLHSKTIPDTNSIYIKPDGKTRLQPRRRIHKIIKGANYSDKYNGVTKYLSIAKEYIINNPDIVNKGHNKIIKDISKACSINHSDAKLVITHLKRKGILHNKTNNILNNKTIDYYFRK